MPSEILAVVCSDLHLSHTPPLIRSEEPDWYAAQERVFNDLEKEFRTLSKYPLIVAGDIFDKWSVPPELINFAIDQFDRFERVLAIPGQHDLPNHDYDQRFRSGYGTLVKSGVIEDLKPMTPKRIFGLEVVGYPWNFEIASPFEDDKEDDFIRLAVIHAYAWKKGASYPGVSDQSSWTSHAKNLKDFNAAVFGDNHIPFEASFTRPNGQIGEIWNNGTMMRRKADEVARTPRFGLLFDDGTFEAKYFDTSEDVISLSEVPDDREEFDFSHYIEELSSLENDSLDFREAVNQLMDKTGANEGVRRFVLEAIE